MATHTTKQELDWLRKHPRLIIPTILVAVGGVFLFVHGLGMAVGSGSGPTQPSAAKAVTPKTWAADACSAYLHKVFEVQSLAFKHGVAWYFDCEQTPIGKYPRAPVALPAGKVLPPLPYRP